MGGVTYMYTSIYTIRSYPNDIRETKHSCVISLSSISQAINQSINESTHLYTAICCERITECIVPGWVFTFTRSVKEFAFSKVSKSAQKLRRSAVIHESAIGKRFRRPHALHHQPRFITEKASSHQYTSSSSSSSSQVMDSMPASLSSASCFGPVLSGSVPVDFHTTTPQYLLSTLCVGGLSCSYRPSSQKTVFLVSCRRTFGLCVQLPFNHRLQ